MSAISSGVGGLMGSNRGGGALSSSLNAIRGTGLISSLSSGSSDALRSDMDGISRGFGPGIAKGTAGGALDLTLDPLTRGARLSGITTYTLGDEGGEGMAKTLLSQGATLAAARAFAEAVGETAKLEGADQTLTTLVPDQPGQYRDMMFRGEELLKSGQFVSAYEHFRVANDIVGRTPEPLLDMAHARFGSARFSYASPAYYIRRALKYMPELPRVPLRPKAFFKSPAVFGDRIIRLETHLDEKPNDGDALLVLAYLRWFAENPNIRVVRRSLQKALHLSDSEEKTEAINIFWDALVAGGKAKGKLTPKPPKPTTQPRKGPTTRPAGETDLKTPG